LLNEYVQQHKYDLQVVEKNDEIIASAHSLPLIINESLNVFQVENTKVVCLIYKEFQEVLRADTVHVPVKIVGLELNQLFVFQHL
jgi:hypothetical protein